MKKILILTVTAGNGHNACAKALKDQFDGLEDVQIKVIDLVKTFGSRFDAWVVDKGYNFMASKMLWLYDMFYNHFLNYSPQQRYNCCVQKIAVGTVGGLLKEIMEFKPDVIYSSHFYGAIALSDIRLKYNLPCKVIVSCLDYVFSPFWQAGIGVDYFTIPNRDFLQQGMALGYNEKQLLPIGIPINKNILEYSNKNVATKEINIKEDEPTILVMFGGGFWSGGYKIFKNIAKAVKGREVNLIMINGKNQRDFKRVEKQHFQGINVVNVGFTDKLPSYLNCADFVVNKCGGISSTEVINMSLPMLVTEKVPAQEKYNLTYLKEKGAILSFKNKKDLKEKVNLLLDDENLRKNMSNQANKLKSNAVSEIADLINKLPNADYSFMENDVDFEEARREIKKTIRKKNKEYRRKNENSSSNR